MGKFDPRSDEGIFLGYSTNSRAYRVFNIHKSIVMESINVVVDDAGLIDTTVEPNWDNSPNNLLEQDEEAKKDEPQILKILETPQREPEVKDPSTRVKLNHTVT